ncbi:unnamed protein product [Paramecium octaurelia]|uniref:Uncharacterized protein n=1 Tax=Paramecium octaurelia TaxID=43137 RepID=A0A8S1T0L2_PAROT|nr:unnamed protein product [Paramecium octaurelia]
MLVFLSENCQRDTGQLKLTHCKIHINREPQNQENKLLLFSLCGYVHTDDNRHQVHKKVIISYLVVKYFSNYQDTQDKCTQKCQRDYQNQMLSINQINNKKVETQKHNDYLQDAKIMKPVFTHLNFIQIFKVLVCKSQGPSIKQQIIHNYINQLKIQYIYAQSSLEQLYSKRNILKTVLNFQSIYSTQFQNTYMQKRIETLKHSGMEVTIDLQVLIMLKQFTNI